MLPAEVRATTLLTLFKLEGQTPLKTGRWSQVDLCGLGDCWWWSELGGIGVGFFVAHFRVLLCEVIEERK